MDKVQTNLLDQINSPALYGIVALAIAMVCAMCVHFMVKS